MDLLHNAWKALDDFNQHASQHIIPAAKEARKQLSKLGNSASAHIQPAADEALKHIRALTHDATMPIPADILQRLDSTAQAGIHHIQTTDWTFLTDLANQAGKHVGTTADETWTALLSGQLLDSVTQKATTLMQDAHHHVPGMGDRASTWAMQYPKQAAALMACILAAPAAIAVTPAALGLVGFTAGGTAAGSLAAVAQAGMGNVMAGSLFSVLQSAGAGGSGLVAVKAIAGSSAMTGTCITAAVSFLEAVKRDGDGEEGECGGGSGSGSGHDNGNENGNDDL